LMKYLKRFVKLLKISLLQKAAKSHPYRVAFLLG
jgi:hypothetical protein